MIAGERAEQLWKDIGAAARPGVMRTRKIQPLGGIGSMGRQHFEFWNMRLTIHSSRRSLSKARLLRRIGITGSLVVFLMAVVEIILALHHTGALH
jgi:hypothetical protein